MIDKKLIKLLPNSMKYTWRNVLVKWISLAVNIVSIFAICELIQRLAIGTAVLSDAGIVAVIIASAIVIRAICTKAGTKLSFLASRDVKKSLREQIYKKLLRFGSSYSENTATSEAVQLCVEGVEQLETYFGGYLPQFYYCMIAPVTLFVVLSFISFKAAIVLLICVPLIPISIIFVQKIAKRIFFKYWGQYTDMGSTFLENLQGLTTLKIYQADEYKNEEMNEQAEKFRKATMKVLVMQLNSITVMDICAYGGAAVGIIIATMEFGAGNVNFAGCLAIILLAADFFLPMRVLGSFFHVAMNGIAASGKIFRILDLPEKETVTGEVNPDNCAISCRDLRFSYEENREILHGVSLDFPKGSFVSIVGESGCGKSTLASIIMGRSSRYEGSVTIGGTQISSITEESRMENITLVAHDSYVFAGTVRENLLYARPDASDELLWAALEKTRLASFLRCENGLDTEIMENASNISGGQRQRLCLARALLHDTPVYIFDEATSNIDMESEADLMELIHEMAKSRTVILISHRLANAVDADRIYVMDGGNIRESGTHEQLLEMNGYYKRLWDAQRSLELYGLNGGAA